MPIIRISLRAGTPPAERTTLVEGVYAALRETFAVAEGDLFAFVHEHEAANFHDGPDDLGIHRSDDPVAIQITANATRTTAQKRALYAAIACNLGRGPGVKPANVLVNLVEVVPENWSFGDGPMLDGPADP
ncbi:tautomerase family protein [Methylobacterium sp. ARG-1]|uniref:tautomerase family protein n=1 Tax=Methylobacterium sp. ARG-1 TaxID=1692501 RepID=UPI00067FCCBA|nr:tautomerase family protein [Methylobacterium sp. ARG-1]KNY21452.1 4-oxalocrotonate tautomerase [Methylobacterium sp. ARG-1]